MLNLFLQFLTFITIYLSINTQTDSGPIVVQQINLINSKGDLNSYIFSSLEGHAMILFSGNNFMNLKDYDLACYFEPLPNQLNSDKLKPYRSEILKDSTSCPIDDYYCIYWTTSYQYTNQQIACYTAKIPEIDRPYFINGLDYSVSILFGDNLKITCIDINKCTIKYGLSYTPVLNFYDSSNFYAGFKMSMRLRPNNNRLDQLINIKIGRYNCIPIIPEVYTDNSSDIIIDCETGDFQTETLFSFMVNYMYGVSSLPFYLKKYTHYNELFLEEPYYFKIFPKIDKITSNSGFTSGGLDLEILGKGFNPDNIQVFIDTTACTNLRKISSTSVTCTTAPSNTDKTTTIFFGSHGLRLKRYDLSSSSANLTKLISLVNTGTGSVILDDIILETTTKPNQGYYYGNYISGFFKAPYTGKYRFWSSSDDSNQVYLTFPDLTGVKIRQCIINFSWYTLFDDFITKTDLTRSSWVNLVENEYYPLEIFHVQNYGDDHFRLGVEISDYGVISLLNPFPNQAHPIINYTLKNNYARDLYEIFVNTVDPSQAIKVGCMDGPTIDLKSSDTPSLFLSKIRTIENYIGENLIIKKLPIDSDQNYFVNANNPAQDYSYSNNLKFENMYLNLSAVVSVKQNLIIKTDGILKGYSFLFFIDKKKSERSYRYENSCYFINPGSTVKNSLILKQYVTEEPNGSFTVNVKDEKNREYKTSVMEFRTDLNKIPAELNKIPLIANNFQLFWKSQGEITSFFFRYNNKLKLQIYFDTTNLKGGYDNSFQSTSEDIIPNGSSNLFFYPIPADFLYTKNIKPQVRVVSNGNEAACLTEVCSFNFSSFSNYPKLNSVIFNKDTNIITATLDKILPSEVKSLNIYLGNSFCIPTSIDTINLSCSFDSLQPGTYTPLINLETGNLPNNPSVIDITISFIITSVDPQTSTANGGKIINISGKNFPNENPDTFSVTISEIPCIITLLTSSRITCINGIKTSTDLTNTSIKITYKTLIYEKSNLFTYTPIQTIPILTSISESYISPGEKKTLTFIFDNLYSFTIDKISITIQHKTLPEYSIKINPLGIIELNKLTARFGGAKPGEYNLLINFQDFGLGKIKNDIIFRVGFEINNISPTIGSIEGGTEITITGKNFLKTHINQNIFIGKTRCLFKDNFINNSNTIKCITQKPSENTKIDSYLPVVIEQMIQYTNICALNSRGNCQFIYDTSKTCKIYRINGSDGNNKLIFGLNENIIIQGVNFIISDTLNKLIFTWGEIEILEKTFTSITGKIINIYTENFLMNEFLMYNDYGLCIQTPEFQYLSYNKVMIFLKKPDLVITGISPLIFGQYGTIIKFYTEVTDFITNKSNTVQICDDFCDILPRNLISDNLNKNHFQCLLKKTLIYSLCNKITIYYYGIKTILDNFLITPVSKYNFSFTNIRNSLNIDINNLNFKIETPNNFNLKIILSIGKIDFTNLKILIDNRYEFKAYSPGVLNSSSKAEYTVNFPNGLPAGQYLCSIFEDSAGFFLPPFNLAVINSLGLQTIDFKLNIPLILNPINAYSINPSFNGGFVYTIQGKNFNSLISEVDILIDKISEKSFQKIFICGFPVNIIEAKSTYIKFSFPQILKKNETFDYISKLPEFNDLLNSGLYSNLVEYYNLDVNSSVLPNLSDDNPYTGIKTTFTGYIGIKIKENFIKTNFKIFLSKIKFFVGDLAVGGDFDNGLIEGSQDGILWSTIMPIPKSIPFIWYTINISYPINFPSKLFSYIRIKPNVISYISEIRFYGHIILDDNSETYKCNLNILDNYNNYIFSSLNINYDTLNDISLVDINPLFTSSQGNTNVIFKFSNSANLIQDDIFEIKIFSNLIPRERISINDSTTIIIKMITKDITKYNRDVPLSIYIERVGNVNLNGLVFQYLDRWSSTDTWGGEFIPSNGETAYVHNADVLIDIDFNLNTLVIEDGSVQVEDGVRDYKLSAKNILVNRGEFNIGSEKNSFKRNLILTLNGDNKDPGLPIFGNKVLAVMEGTLGIFGKERNPTYTLLSSTAKQGDLTIQVLGEIDWVPGDVIVIASSSHIPSEAEKRTIKQINKEIPLNPILTLDQPLNYGHYGDIETYSNNGVVDTIDMRAEIILLTRNVVIQGDESSINSQYGVHIMLAAMKMGMKSVVGKLSNVEVRKAGQAFQLGRYPIHFHMIGDVSGSYVRNCAVHDSYNRAIAIHAVNNFLVENNVVYNIMGHAFFIEDAVETNNIIRNNVGILTKSSYSLLLTDYTPATFWITNPSNSLEKNRAAGSEFYGFWMDIPQSATGLNAGLTNFCPRGMPLGMFKDNVSHSNGKYGFRIFPEFFPKNKPCQTVNNIDVFTIPAIFENFTIYRNKEKGIITEKIGDVKLKGSRVAENPLSSIEVSDLIRFDNGMASIEDAVIIGYTKNPVSQNNLSYETLGLITPRNDNFLINNVRFYNFDKIGLIAPLSSCSRCEASSASTDSDGRTIFFKNIKFDKTITKKVKWAQPKKAIYRDLDGSLTGIGPTGGWVTPYYPHLLVNECNRDLLWDDGIICDNTVQVRRIVFYEIYPYSINLQDLKIIQIPKLNPIDPLLLADDTKFSIIKYKGFRNPSYAWTSAFVTGYNYLLTWGLGLNFDSLSVERSNMWESSDKPINLAFNYSVRRDEYSVKGFDNSSIKYNNAEVADNSEFESPNNFKSFSDNLLYGSYKNLIEKKNLILRINSKNPKFFTNLKLIIAAIQCKNNDCGTLPPTPVIIDPTKRKWSDPTNWPNKMIPVEGDEVEIQSGWQMKLDIPTEKLKSLTINGYLYFDDTVDNLSINSNIILVKDGRLEIGSKLKPFEKKAYINLLGDKFSRNLVIDNTMQLTNKILANLNEISIFGEDRSPYRSKLFQSAKIGEKKLIVEKDLKWFPGDEISVSSSSFAHNETEKFNISSYDPQSGEITIEKSFIYNHYGASFVYPLSDNPTIPLITPDERADVFMLTRNIKIKGNEEWGCNVNSISYKTNNFIYNGRMNLSNVEFNYCGQMVKEFPALQFLGTNSQIPSNFTDISFNNNNYIGINIQKSSNLNFNNILVYNPKKFGVNVIDSYNINLINVYVLRLDKRPYPEQLQINEIIDINSCFSICQERSLNCQNIKLSNTTCAGSEFIGYIIEAFDCGIDLKLNLSYNTAYSSQIGFIITNNLKRTCTKSGNFISMRNWMNGYSSNNLVEISYHENIISINDRIGISILSATKNTNTRKSAERILVVGQSFVNPLCLPVNYCNPDLKCQQQGFVISITSINPLKIPISKKSFPLENPKGDSAFGSFFDGNLFTFAKFEDQCDYKSFAMKTNIYASDLSSIHNFKNLILNKVLEDNFIYFDDPSSTWVGDPCGGFPCSGPNNVIVKIINFINSAENQDNSKIIINPKWPNFPIKKYLTANRIFDGKTTSDYLKDGVTIIPNKFSFIDCFIINIWNGIVCPIKRELGLIFIQNTENSADTRNISPIFIENKQEYFNNKINSFMDHKCEDGYPSHLRTPIHPSIVTMDSIYDITFTSTNPTRMKIQMYDTRFPYGLKKSGIFKIKYTNPQTVLVFNADGKEVKSRDWKEGESLVISDSSLKCGENKWTTVENSLVFYITNETSCILTLKAVNSIQLSLRLNITVEEFYSKGSSNQLIYNIAAVLGIPPEQIRITGILKGSAIVNTEILEKIPTVDDKVTAVGSADSTGNMNTNSGSSKNSLIVDGKLNLRIALDTLISSIQLGSLNLPGPILDLKYSVVSPDTPTPTIIQKPLNPTSTEANNPLSSSTGNTDKNSGNPSGSINITNPFNPIFNYTVSTNQSNYSGNKGNFTDIIIQTQDSNDRRDFFIIIFVICGFFILILIIAIGCIIHKLKQNRILKIKKNITSGIHEDNKNINVENVDKESNNRTENHNNHPHFHNNVELSSFINEINKESSCVKTNREV